MRRQPRLVRIRIKTLDERHLVRGLIRQVVPLVSRIVLDAVRPTFAGGVNQARGDEICVDVDGAKVGDAKRVVGHGVLDRSTMCMRSVCIQ